MERDNEAFQNELQTKERKKKKKKKARERERERKNRKNLRRNFFGIKVPKNRTNLNLTVF